VEIYRIFVVLSPSQCNAIYTDADISIHIEQATAAVDLVGAARCRVATTAALMPMLWTSIAVTPCALLLGPPCYPGQEPRGVRAPLPDLADGPNLLLLTDFIKVILL
jgi:hypothetical protein